MKAFKILLGCLMFVALLGAGGKAMAASYLIRPGDVLDVMVFQDQKLNRQIAVAPDGRISFPLAGISRPAAAPSRRSKAS